MARALSRNTRLPPSGVTLLQDLVHQRTSLYFKDAQSDIFLGKLSPLVLERGFDSLLDYYYLLKYDSGPADEWRKLFDALTVQE